MLNWVQEISRRASIGSTLVLSFLPFGSVAAHADTPVGTLNQFSAGQAISSAKVNANFDSLRTAVNSLIAKSPAGALYATPGSYSLTIPAGVTQVEVRIAGAASGGQSGTSSVDGGSGGWVTAYAAVSAGDSLSITVGAGGAGGNCSLAFSNGLAGGNTIVQNGANWSVTQNGAPAMTGGGCPTPSGTASPASAATGTGSIKLLPQSSSSFNLSSAGSLMKGGALNNSNALAGSGSDALVQVLYFP